MGVIIQLLVVSAYGQPSTEAAVDVDGFLDITMKCNPGDLKCNKINKDNKKKINKMQIIKMRCKNSGSLICRYQNFLSALDSRKLEGFDLQPVTTDTTISDYRSDILNHTMRFFQYIASSTQTFQPDDHTKPIVPIVTYNHLTSKTAMSAMTPISKFQPTTSIADTNPSNVHSDMDDHNSGIYTKNKKQPVGEIILLLVCGILVGLWAARRRVARNKRRQRRNMYQ